MLAFLVVLFGFALGSTSISGPILPWGIKSLLPDLQYAMSLITDVFGAHQIEVFVAVVFVFLRFTRPPFPFAATPNL
jgi:hypothetical protein